jgi:glycosyltransferase involved in cell wall biosynthesis
VDSKSHAMMLFSIIIPTYNRAAFVSKAIDSVFAQEYANWELIIVDDASTDHTTEVLARYVDPRICIIVNESNLERSASRNRGVSKAKGEYICFLDSDDYFLPHHLTSLDQAIQQAVQKVALFHTGVKQYHEKENRYRDIVRSSFVNPVEAVVADHIPVITVAMHRSIMNQFQFDPTMRINEDVYLFAQVAASFPLVYIPEVSVIWVLHGNNTTDQVRDYWSPQLQVFNHIADDLVLGKYLSKAFKTEKKFGLYTELVYFHATQHHYTKAISWVLKGFLLAPFKQQNITNVLNVLYHLPAGHRLKWWVAKIKQRA